LRIGPPKNNIATHLTPPYQEFEIVPFLVESSLALQS
jgi:hypothetical protein